MKQKNVRSSSKQTNITSRRKYGR